MSLANALRFISLVREDKDLATEIELADSFDSICASAGRRGIAFTPDEFVRAFGHEWSIRWMANKTVRQARSAQGNGLTSPNLA